MKQRLLPLLMLLLTFGIFGLMGQPITAQGAADTLVLVLGADIDGLNAVTEQSAVSNTASSFIWPALFDVDPNSGLPQPGLTSWEISEDGLTYTFTIREGAQWSDGTPITAHDAKFTLDALTNPQVASPFAGIATWSAVNVIDDLTFEIVVPTIDCSFLSQLQLGLMPSHRFAPDYSDFMTNTLNSTPDIAGGPYILEEYAPDEFLRYRSNPLYWKGEPKIPNLIFRIIPDSEVRLQALLNGDIDLSTVTADEELAVVDNPNLNLVRVPSNSFLYLTLNLADPNNPMAAVGENGELNDQGPHPVFGDLAVRKAVVLGYDKQAIMELYGEGATRTVGTVPPMITWAYNSELEIPPYDPEAAAALLEEAGWVDADGDGVREKDGVLLEFQLDYIPGQAETEALALLVQDQLGQVGFRVNLNAGEQQSLFGTRLLPQTFDAFVLSINGGSVSDPNYLSNFVLNSASDIPNAGLNTASYANPQVDEILAQARTVPGCAVEDRAELYHQMQEVVQEDAVADFVGSTNVRFAYNKRIQGISVAPWSTFYNVHEWTLAE